MTRSTICCLIDALNVALERLEINNYAGEESPYIAVIEDALQRAHEAAP